MIDFSQMRAPSIHALERRAIRSMTSHTLGCFAINEPIFFYSVFFSYKDRRKRIISDNDLVMRDDQSPILPSPTREQRGKLRIPLPFADHWSPSVLIIGGSQTIARYALRVEENTSDIVMDPSFIKPMTRERSDRGWLDEQEHKCFAIQLCQLSP